MKTLMTFVLGSLVVFSVFAGCEFRKIVLNDPISPAQVQFIVSGRTTFSDVVEQIGAPDEIKGDGTDLVFRYHYLVSKGLRVNFGSILRIWSPVSPAMILSRGEAGTDVFQVVFDSHGIAQEHAFSKHIRNPRFNFWPF
jgi:hypothetical protein